MLQVVPTTKAIAEQFVTLKHYSRRKSIFWAAFALVEDGVIQGVVVYGQPSPPIQKHAFKDRDFRLYELARLVVQTKTKNAASFLVGRSLQMLEAPCAVVSYADMEQQHCGIVYQATNWLYTGATKSHDKAYIVDGKRTHPMTLRDRGITDPTRWAKENGIEMVKPAEKHRYFFLVGSKREKKDMLAKLAYPIAPGYPKCDQRRYDDGPTLQIGAGGEPINTESKMNLSIDFETASQCDLIGHGVYRYAQDPTTRVLIMAWAFDDEPVQVWTPDQPFPQRVIDHVKAGGAILAWNAAFERLIWWYVLSPDHGVPEPKLEQFRCTAARARAHALPGKLSDCAKALNLPIQKMTEGKRLIDTYCAPNHQTEMTPDDKQLFIEYCRVDVEVERQIGSVLRELTDYEWAEYHQNERTNDRGVPVDVPFAKAALSYASEVRDDVNARVLAVTKCQVPTARAIKQRDIWLRSKLTAEHLDLIEVNGKIKFGQEYRDAIRAAEIPDDVRTFVDLVDEAGGATIGKYKSMVNREVDGRLQGALVFNGAGQTGRFASMGIQLHNLRRDGMDDPDTEIDYVVNGYEVPEVTTTLARLVRASIHLKKGLRWFDFSAIEGRVAPWLEGGELGQAKLDLYRQGIDPYVFNASRTYGIPMDQVTKAQRQAGKVQELALGFLGGVGALQSMSRMFGLTIPDDEALRMRDVWREANPWAMRIGNLMDTAAHKAIRAPGQWFEAGRVAYACDGKDWLWCRLPSGRLMAYFQPRIEPVMTPWGEERMAVTCLQGSVKPKAGKPWPRRSMHPGIWLENCIAEGTEVLTDSGWKPIENITPLDLVHDGVEFVTHTGLLFKSVQACVSIDGVLMTPDHEVLTDDGWKAASTDPEPYRPDLRGVDGGTSWASPQTEPPMGVPMQLRSRNGTEPLRSETQAPPRLHPALRPLETGWKRLNHAWAFVASRVLGLAEYARPLPFAFAPSVAQLRGERYQGVRSMGFELRGVLGRRGQQLRTGFDLGAGGQQPRVHPPKLRVGDAENAVKEQEDQSAYRNAVGAYNGGGSKRAKRGERNDDPVSTSRPVESPRCGHSTAEVFKQVWDIQNCGPRNRFVVRGVTGPFVVHNCTQAAAADLLREALMRCADEGIKVVLSVHDEIVAEGTDVDELGRVMLQNPDWADNLPLAGEGGTGTRYGK